MRNSLLALIGVFVASLADPAQAERIDPTGRFVVYVAD